MAASKIPLYDSKQVHTYQVALAWRAAKAAGEKFADIQWKPWRERDRGVKFAWHWRNGRLGSIWTECMPYFTRDPLYDGILPVGVLATVEKIHSHLSEASFFVSCIARHPALFLGVAFPEQSLMVVDCWGDPALQS